MDLMYCIVVDKSKLTNPDLWIKTYEQHILAVVRAHDGNERIVFAISPFSDIRVVADWLFIYSNYIDYDTSYRNIEAAHKVLDNSLRLRIDSELQSHVGIKKSVTLNDIKAKLKLKDTSFNDFDTYNYEKYMEVTINGGVIDFDFLPRYDVFKYCISFPFIRSLKKITGLTDVMNIDFVETTDSNGNKFIGFKFKIANEEFYYDYSQKPPVGPEMIPSTKEYCLSL